MTLRWRDPGMRSYEYEGITTDGEGRRIPNTFQRHDIIRSKDLAPIPAPEFVEPRFPDDECCVLCGRRLSPAAVERSWWIHLITDGTLAPAHWADNDPDHFGEQGINDQGWFPVGSECAKTIPITHRRKEQR